MASITDDRGFNQGFAETTALAIRTSRRMQAIAVEMDAQRAISVLELGCGTGFLSFLLASHINGRVTGVDLCDPFIQEARRRYCRNNLTYSIVDIGNQDFARRLGSTFDYIVGNGVLHHLGNDLPLVLARCKSILNPGGRLIFWEPNLHNPYIALFFTVPILRKCIKLEPEETAFTQKGITRHLRKAGFSMVKVRCRDFLLPCTPSFLVNPVIALSDFAERIPGIRNVAQSVFVVAGV